MKIQNADGLLSKTIFNNQDDWMTYPESIYTCTICQEKISFTLRDLNNHSLSSETNLTDKDNLIVNEFAKLGHVSSNSFLDFYCPNCKRPVRVYYESWAGGKHGEAGHIINYIVE